MPDAESGVRPPAALETVNLGRWGWIRIAGPLLALAVGIVAPLVYLHPVAVLRFIQRTRLGWAGVSQHEIALNDGLLSYFVTSGYEGMEPVMMIHGLGPTAALEWREVMEPLSEAHYKVYAPDLPGFASSEHKQVDYTIAYQAAAVDQLIDALKLDHVNLIGHDLGADVAMYEAVEHPDKIERLILVSGGLIGTAGGKALRANLMPQTTDALRAQVANSFFDLPPMPDFVYQRMMLDVAADLYAESDMLASIAKDEGHIRARISQVFNLLTVMIWGGKDQIIGSAHADELHALLPGSATAIFKATGHTPQLEHPEEFDEALLFFLKQKEGGR